MTTTHGCHGFLANLSVCLRCPSTLILGTGFAGPTPLDFLTRVPAALLDRVPDFEFFIDQLFENWLD